MKRLGRYTFADIVSYRLDQTRVRSFAALGSLTVVCCYLVVQMVGAGQLIKLLFGLDYSTAVVVVGALMLVYVIFGGMLATTWVQITKAVLLLGGGTTLAVLALARFDFSFETLAEQAVALHASGAQIMGPGSLLADPINAVSLSLGLVFGIAGLPHTTELAHKNAERGLVVITMCMADGTDDDEKALALKKLKENGVNLENYVCTLGGSDDSFKAYNIGESGLPHYKIYDRTGQLAKELRSDVDIAVTATDVDEHIEKLLGAE